MTTRIPEMIMERRQALGLIVEHSATMESTLRSAFCSLVGSKYATIVAGGQPVGWLIEQCKALADANLEIDSAQRDDIKAALESCRAANEQRNSLVHGVKTASRMSDGSLQTIRSRRGNREPMVEPWTPATIREVAVQLAKADLQLFGAMQRAVSSKLMVMDSALYWERQPGGG
jgi:hypothetical protein